MAKIGDTVRFLNSIGGGTITRIDGNIAHVEDEDGFDVPVLLRECVVVQGPVKPQTTKEPKPAASAKAPSKEIVVEAPKIIELELPIIETEDGDKLNLLIAFEPLDIKKLSTTRFETTLVNDSNYYVAFAYATRNDDDSEWTLRRQDVVEPNIMLSLGEIGAEDLNDMKHIVFQYFAFKQDKSFEIKAPASVEIKLDITKFCKLHCFRENSYFDEPVLALNLVSDDKPYSPVKLTTKEIESEIRRKKALDRQRPMARPIKKRNHEAKNGIIEVDLHINELVDNTNGLSRADMINLQIDEFRRVMDSNIKNHGQKIVFIHGKGEGVLRQALLKELGYRYKGHDVCDASFREYGFGATQVTIR